MKKLIIASASAIALFGLAACSDSTDGTTTQSVNPPADTTTTAPEATPTTPSTTPDTSTTAPESKPAE